MHSLSDGGDDGEGDEVVVVGEVVSVLEVGLLPDVEGAIFCHVNTGRVGVAAHNSKRFADSVYIRVH